MKTFYQYIIYNDQNEVFWTSMELYATEEEAIREGSIVAKRNGYDNVSASEVSIKGPINLKQQRENAKQHPIPTNIKEYNAHHLTSNENNQQISNTRGMLSPPTNVRKKDRAQIAIIVGVIALLVAIFDSHIPWYISLSVAIACYLIVLDADKHPSK